MSRAVRTSFWILFALLLTGSGVRLLFDCALNLPLLGGLQFCPVATDHGSLQTERQQRENLQLRIHEAEVALARKAPCESCSPGAPVSLQPEFALLLDNTESMGAVAKLIDGRDPPAGSPTKLAIVKSALAPAIEGFGARRIHFVKFEACSSKMTVYETGREVARRIRSISSSNGQGAPIAALLRDAANLFRAAPDGKYYANILIVTDVGVDANGLDECRQDVCAAAREVASAKPGIAINLVDLENSTSLRCIPEATNGRFFQRGSAMDLRRMIEDAKTFPGASCDQQLPRGLPTRRT